MQGNNLENVETKQMDGNPDPILCEVKGERARERERHGSDAYGGKMGKLLLCCCSTSSLITCDYIILRLQLNCKEAG
jgi:hypothetical protein